MNKGNDSTIFPHNKKIAAHQKINGDGMMEHHFHEVILSLTKDGLHQLSKVIACHKNVILLHVWQVRSVRVMQKEFAIISTSTKVSWIEESIFHNIIAYSG